MKARAEPTAASHPPRAHARAAAILAVIGLCLLDGCPVPRMEARHLADPLNRTELERWAGLLGSAGLAADADDLGRGVVAASERLRAAHGAAMSPFRPAFDALGIRQRFVLFPVAKRRFLRLRVDAKRAGEPYRLVYRPGDPAHPAPFPALEYRRVRALLTAGSLGPNPELPAISAWVARELFERDPSLTLVRTGYAWAEIAPGGGALREDPELAFAHAHERNAR